MTALDIKSKVATQKQASEVLGLSVPTIRNLIRSGQLRTVTFGARRRYIPIKELERYAEEVTG